MRKLFLLALLSTTGMAGAADLKCDLDLIANIDQAQKLALMQRRSPSPQQAENWLLTNRSYFLAVIPTNAALWGGAPAPEKRPALVKPNEAKGVQKLKYFAPESVPAHLRHRLGSGLGGHSRATGLINAVNLLGATSFWSLSAAKELSAKPKSEGTKSVDTTVPTKCNSADRPLVFKREKADGSCEDDVRIDSPLVSKLGDMKEEDVAKQVADPETCRYLKTVYAKLEPVAIEMRKKFIPDELVAKILREEAKPAQPPATLTTEETEIAR